MRNFKSHNKYRKDQGTGFALIIIKTNKIKRKHYENTTGNCKRPKSIERIFT